MKEPLRAGDVLLTSEAPTGEVLYSRKTLIGVPTAFYLAFEESGWGIGR